MNKSKQIIVKTPIQLELENLNYANLSQQKTIQVQYHLLRLLNEIVINNPEIVNTPMFTNLFTQLLNFQEFQSIKTLPLFEDFSYRLWSNEAFSYQIRQKTSLYKIVSNWIIYFELKSGNLEEIQSKFDLIATFMEKQTSTVLERIVMIEEVFQDLKEFIDEDFWLDYSDQSNFSKKKQKNSNFSISCLTKILDVLGAIINPIFYRLQNLTYKNCTYTEFKFNHVKQFIKRCIYYLLKQQNIPVYQQTNISKIALIYLQSLSIQQSQQIIKMLKQLMIKTTKAVRFALIIQYVQFYQYLQMMGFQNVIQQLQGMIYFRELIIGKKMVQENILEIGNTINNLNLSYHQLYIKAGISKKIYFSSQSPQNILKLDVFLEENDINIKINYHTGISIQKSKIKNLNKFIFDTVEKINEYDGSKLNGQKCYWKQQKSTSKKLQLKLNYQGLYCIEFDNMYSWVIPKNIRYRIQIYRPFK